MWVITHSWNFLTTDKLKAKLVGKTTVECAREQYTIGSASDPEQTRK